MFEVVKLSLTSHMFLCKRLTSLLDKVSLVTAIQLFAHEHVFFDSLRRQLARIMLHRTSKQNLWSNVPLIKHSLLLFECCLSHFISSVYYLRVQHSFIVSHETWLKVFDYLYKRLKKLLKLVLLIQNKIKFGILRALSLGLKVGLIVHSAVDIDSRVQWRVK